MEPLVTKNQDLKRRAREYRKSHPDIRLADAMRAVAPPDTSDRATWSVGGTPWIRRAEVPSSCFFCGQDTIIRSMTDMATDNGRVEIYCDTGDCDAREVEVIVVEDGTTATRSRTDVRIMRHIAPANPHILWTGPGSAWAAGTAPALRMRTGWMTCVFCGETTCALSRNDVDADTGRIRVHCNNRRCAMQEAEVLLMRDGYGNQAEREDVKAIRGLFVSRADKLAADLSPGQPPIFPVSDWAVPADGMDPLQMRISGQLPWEK